MEGKHQRKPVAPVLVIGGTGATGRLVVANLVATGERVRVLTRDPTKARRLLPAGVELVAGDLKRPADVLQALRGARTVVMAHGSDDGRGTAEDTDYGGVFNVVKQLGTDPVKLVLMSAIYVTRPDHPRNAHSPIFEWKRRAEELVRSSGHPYVIARASWLVDERQPRVGTRLEQGDQGDGSVSYAAMARVLANASASAHAVGKTFEVYADAAVRPTSREPAFSDLLSDPVVERLTA